MSLSQLNWRWRHFDHFSTSQWHEILALRAEVFVVEQNCPYLDPDHKDPQCFHLTAVRDNRLVATCRVVPPSLSYDEASIGRVVVSREHRGEQLGRQIMQRGVAFIEAMYGGGIRISGQAYLESFYQSLGFNTVHGPYMEDDIPHFEMLRPA